MTRTVSILMLLALAGPSFAENTASIPADATAAMSRELTRPAVHAPVLHAFVNFQQLVGVKMKVDWASLTATGISEADTVNVQAPQATGGQLLDMMLARLAKPGKPLAWYIDGNEVRVSTQQRVMALKRGRQPTASRMTRSQPTSQPAGPTYQLSFDATPLVGVLDYLRTVSGRSLVVNWPSLESSGLGRSTPVTLQATDVSFPSALTLVTDLVSGRRDKFARVYWLADRGVITIATGETLNNRLITRVYEVGDLLHVAPDAPAPRPSLKTQSSGKQNSTPGTIFGQRDSGDEQGESPTESKSRMQEDLVGMIRDSIGTDMWQPIGKGTIRLHNGRLIISQTPLGYKLLEQASRRSK